MVVANIKTTNLFDKAKTLVKSWLNPFTSCLHRHRALAAGARVKFKIVYCALRYYTYCMNAYIAKYMCVWVTMVEYEMASPDQNINPTYMPIVVSDNDLQFLR